MPFACSMADTLLLSGGRLLVVDGKTQQVITITLQGTYCCTGIELIKLLLGLTKLFPITPTPMEADKRQKAADERYKEYVIGGRYSE